MSPVSETEPRLSVEPVKIQIPDKMYFRIGEVSDLLDVKPHVLRYWESEFPKVAPEKSPNGQRLYARADVESLLVIKRLLYAERYSIEGARKKLALLKKGKQLEEFREDTVSQMVERPSLSSEARERILTKAREMKLLAQAPIQKLFLLAKK